MFPYHKKDQEKSPRRRKPRVKKDDICLPTSVQEDIPFPVGTSPLYAICFQKNHEGDHYRLCCSGFSSRELAQARLYAFPAVTRQHFPLCVLPYSSDEDIQGGILRIKS